MSSSAGAAIGVTEGIAVILREAVLLPTLGDKLVLFAIGILFFGVTLQAGFALMRLLQRYLGRRTVRDEPRRLGTVECPTIPIFRPDLFAGQTIIVTGGGSGLGRCTAHELKSLGARLALIGRTPGEARPGEGGARRSRHLHLLGRPA